MTTEAESIATVIITTIEGVTTIGTSGFSDIGRAVALPSFTNHPDLALASDMFIRVITASMSLSVSAAGGQAITDTHAITSTDIILTDGTAITPRCMK